MRKIKLFFLKKILKEYLEGVKYQILSISMELSYAEGLTVEEVDCLCKSLKKYEEKEKSIMKLMETLEDKEVKQWKD